MAPGLILPEDGAGAIGFEASPADVVHWHRQAESRGAAKDLDWAMERLGEFKARAASDEHVEDVLRVYVPEPTVAFGQRDTRLPGYREAFDAVREHGFTPVTRRAGGRAAAYHHGCVVVDHLALEPDAAISQQDRFAEFADLFVDAFGRMGVDASIGEIPGEYCPGEFSVQGAAPDFPVKLAGSAQRVVKGAWLFSTHVVVRDAGPLRDVLTDVYDALEMPMDPRTVGSAEDVRPGADVEEFVEALHGAYTAWAMERGRVLVDAPA